MKNISKEVDDKIVSETQFSRKYEIPKNDLSVIVKPREKNFGTKMENLNVHPK